MNRRVLTLITISFLLTTSSRTQGLREQTVKFQSPLSMIEMMEKRLGAQFQAHAEPVASPSSVVIGQDGKTVAHGTILSGTNTQYSYVVFPADALSSPRFEIKTASGKSLNRIPGAPLQLLSKTDNLAIARLVYTKEAISTDRALIRSSVGAFIGLMKPDKNWKTGAITNSLRSAYTGVDPGTQRALSRHWERIGLKVSKKRSGFPEVIETDLDLLPTEAGAPIFDRKGNWHGVTISRADQHSTLVIPAARIITLINGFEKAHRS